MLDGGTQNVLSGSPCDSNDGTFGRTLAELLSS